MQIVATNQNAYDLFHTGTHTFHLMEKEGWRIDLGHVDRELTKLDETTQSLDEQLLMTPEISRWKEHYGDKFNIESTQQKSHVLFKLLGYSSNKQTGSGADSADKEVLADIKEPFAVLLLQRGKAVNTRNTLRAIRRETVPMLEDPLLGILRPSFNLNTASSYRSSCTDPNNQNWPIRDKKQGEFIRRCLIAAKGYHIGEHDSSGQEVRIAACYCQDPVLINYILDKSTDMHRDAASECYLLTHDQVSKDIRYCGKNKFVFPQFYGDWYKSCAATLWKSIADMKLCRTDGMPLMDHLRMQGIKNYKMFEKHIQEVEHIFWYERFNAYREWRDWLYKHYLETGTIQSLTGFTYRGDMRKNEVLNIPIQGSAFHCLLWILNRVVAELTAQGASTKVIGQVHDSIIAHIEAGELVWYDSLIRHYAEEIREAWPWIIVPLEFEADIAPEGKTWFDKQKWPWKEKAT